MLRAIVRTVIPYGLLLLGIAAILAFSVLSPSYEECTASHHKQTADPEKAPPPPKSEATFTEKAMVFVECESEFVHRNGESIIALFTVVLAFSTIALWSATRGLYEAGERQFAATFRPKLVVREVHWIKDAIALTIENVGGSLCTIVESDFVIRSSDPDGRALRTPAVNRIGRVTLAAGAFHDHIHKATSAEEMGAVGYSTEAKEGTEDVEGIVVAAYGHGYLSLAYFQGTIVYEDDSRAKVRRRLTILRACQSGSSRLVRTGNPEDENTDD